MSVGGTKLRWDPYILARGGNEFDGFWKSHLGSKTRRVAVVAGLGFDVRACIASEQILAAGGAGARDLWLICYENAQADAPVLKPLVDVNDNRFVAAFTGRGAIQRLPLSMRRADGRMASAAATQKVVVAAKAVLDYDDVVVDISAMPRMISLVVLSQIMSALDERRKKKQPVANLHVVAAESAAMDVDVSEESLAEEVVNVTGFTGRIGAESISNPKIWFPVLGEGQKLRLQRIYEKLQPDEICPVIPFPSQNPRRGDALIEEYRATLFEEYRVDPRNILYASESNPFEAYRQLFGAIERYKTALKDLDYCRVVISPLSSKVLSVGALLAAYDHRSSPTGHFHVGMHYVEAGIYQPPAAAVERPYELISMWIVGEWEDMDAH